jgi:hypothetical protein
LNCSFSESRDFETMAILRMETQNPAMRFGRETLGNEFVLLAPRPGMYSPSEEKAFGRSRYHRLLAEAQRLRGRVYVLDGAMDSRGLSPDGRHIQRADDLSWHLLAVDKSDRVAACIRYFARSPRISFSDLSVSQSAIARSPEWGPKVRAAVEAELDRATLRGLSYVEIGGWAVSPEWRFTSGAVKMLLSVYALARLTGGALGLSGATTRHHSSSILKRVGGSPLMAGNEEIRSYFDPQYNCQMELLRFDSNSPNPKYAAGIQECGKAIVEAPLLFPAYSETYSNDLLALHLAVNKEHESPEYWEASTATVNSSPLVIA